MQRILNVLIYLAACFFLVLSPVLTAGCNIDDPGAQESTDEPAPAAIASGWAVLSGKRWGKVVFARPPRMIVLDLSTGIEREVPGIVTAGAKGRRLRGKSPRPFWGPDGKRFVYRYNGSVYVSDEEGNKKIIHNERMDCSDETRWSWYREQEKGTDWLVGPSIEGNVLLVKVSEPSVVRVAYGGGDVELHCELTGSGRYVVYDDGSDIYVTAFGNKSKGKPISKGQSCRPCASPDDRAAWLPSPHTRYHIYDASNGNFLGDLPAPKGEEIYRLNWSNDPDFAVHMYGSRGNTRIQVRKVSTGEHLFVGNGWDPDLWVESRKYSKVPVKPMNRPSSFNRGV
jgi:hypothetical protein